jgi:D-3-phosphoglycerate dehydrogenase
MAKILINDGIHPAGLELLQKAGHDVSTTKIEQADLPAQLPAFNAICVRSATKVRQDLIDLCPDLKVIGRGGVGMDNIDVDYARSKGIAVVNTPAASSRSVAELVFGHLLSISRFLHNANEEMPTEGHTAFKALKKNYSKGIELEGKTMGIIGLGRIGQATAQIALGMGMNVLGVDPYVSTADISVGPASANLTLPVQTVSMDDMLAKADCISLHVPSQDKPVLGAAEFAKMKDGVMIVNASRGGTIDEDALLQALTSGKVGRVGLDVFDNEPSPREDLLKHKLVSVSPHIGASTGEAQAKIGIELAQQLLEILG